MPHALSYMRATRNIDRETLACGRDPRRLSFLAVLDVRLPHRAGAAAGRRSQDPQASKRIAVLLSRSILMGMICLFATIAACPTPDPSQTPDANAGDLPFARFVTAPHHHTTATLTGISISSSGPGAIPPGYASYIAHPLSPTAPQIDTPYDLVTTNSLRDGTSMDLRITDLRQFAFGKWQIGTTLDVYGFLGDRSTARYWGSAPPFLDNPVEQQHFVHAMLGPSSIVALRPDTHVQLTAGNIPSTWFSTITIATVPETNAGYLGGRLLRSRPLNCRNSVQILRLGSINGCGSKLACCGYRKMLRIARTHLVRTATGSSDL